MLKTALVAAALAGAGLIPVLAPPPAEQPWLDPRDPGRDSRPETRAILEALAPRPGETIADIGAGGGYFTFKLARLVGPGGKVVATDLDIARVKSLAAYAKRRGYANVAALHVAPQEPGPAAGLDKVLIVNLYYFTDAPRTRAYFQQVHGLLSPHGRVVLYQDDTGCPGPGSGWKGCILSGAEMAAALEGSFSLERDVPLGNGKARAPYLLVFRREAAGS